MSFSHEYNFPTFVVKEGVLTTGNTSNLVAGQIGIYNGQTYTSAIGAPLGKYDTLRVAGGSWHTVDKLSLYTGGLKQSDKSIEFRGKDILLFERSTPRPAVSEQWTIGWDGVSTTNTLNFECGQTYRFKVKVWGEDVYGTYLRPVEREIEITTGCCGETACSEGCPDYSVSNKYWGQQLAMNIANDPELQWYVQAEMFSSDMVAGATTQYLWNLTVVDDGSIGALAAVQAAYPQYPEYSTAPVIDEPMNPPYQYQTINRISRTGLTSVYQMCLPTTAGTPAAFTPTVPIPLSTCNVCPAGTTTTASYDYYVISRTITPTTDLSTPTAQNTYAATIVAAYSAVSGKFLSLSGSIAKVEIAVTAGATVTTLDSDRATYTKTNPVLCVPTAGSSIAWVNSGNAFKATRPLQITIPKTCGGSNQLAALQAFYANEPTITASTIAVLTSGQCSDIYQVYQSNNECLTEGCLSQTSPTYSTLQAFQGFLWVDATQIPTSDASGVQVGVRLTAAYQETLYGDCSFFPIDYYSVRPLKLEVTALIGIGSSALSQDGNPCTNLTPTTKTRFSSMSTQSGEWAVREFIKSYKYRVHGEYFADPRAREALDNIAFYAIDRTKNYNAYFLKVIQYRDYQNFIADFSPEVVEMQILFPTDVDPSGFEAAFESITSQFGVYLKDR